MIAWTRVPHVNIQNRQMLVHKGEMAWEWLAGYQSLNGRVHRRLDHEMILVPLQELPTLPAIAKCLRQTFMAKQTLWVKSPFGRTGFGEK